MEDFSQKDEMDKIVHRLAKFDDISGDYSSNKKLLYYSPLKVDSHFDISNGLTGLKRDALLCLCDLMCWKNMIIRVIIGMCEEHFVWKSHSYFKKSRKKCMASIYRSEVPNPIAIIIKKLRNGFLSGNCYAFALKKLTKKIVDFYEDYEKAIKSEEFPVNLKGNWKKNLELLCVVLEALKTADVKSIQKMNEQIVGWCGNHVKGEIDFICLSDPTKFSATLERFQELVCQCKRFTQCITYVKLPTVHIFTIPHMCEILYKINLHAIQDLLCEDDAAAAERACGVFCRVLGLAGYGYATVDSKVLKKDLTDYFSNEVGITDSDVVEILRRAL